MNSAAFRYLVGIQLARTELAQSYEVGLIQQTPIPDQSKVDVGALSKLARRAWSLKRWLDTTNEVSHAFALHVTNPGLLLDAWRETYDFSKHQILRGHVSSRTSEEGLRHLVGTFTTKKLRCAATGLGAAWFMTQFAGFRLMTVYVAEEPSEAALKAVGFRAEERGANAWLVVPTDAGVFDGAEDREGVLCVHPVQAYLDLKGQPERAEEAATELRKRLLNWKA
jgi:hypothetical protein